MCNDHTNKEGYPDPTAHQAIRAVEMADRRYRPLVYICSPFSGDVEANVRATRWYCRVAVNAGVIPIAPHLLYPQFMDDGNPTERDLGLFFGQVLLGRCEEVWVCGERISEGMEAEIKKARWKGLRIRYFDAEMKEVNEYGV